MATSHLCDIYYNVAAEAKVKIFLEGHKNLLNLPFYFDITKFF